jgi:hypothetical protein
MSVKEVALRLAKRKKVYPVQTDDGSLYVRGLNGVERNQYFESITNGATDLEKLVANQRLIAAQLCNEDGTPVFDDEKEGFETILQWDIASYVKPAVDEILRASGMKDDSPEQAAKK